MSMTDRELKDLLYRHFAAGQTLTEAIAAMPAEARELMSRPLVPGRDYEELTEDELDELDELDALDPPPLRSMSDQQLLDRLKDGPERKR